MVRPTRRRQRTRRGPILPFDVPRLGAGRPARWFVALAAAWLGSASLAAAEVRFSGLSSAPGSGIAIEIVGLYDSLPKAGYAPLRIKIRNDTDRERSWRFLFSSTPGFRRQERCEYAWRATVGAGRERVYELLVPLAAVRNHENAYPSLSVYISGYGLNDPRGQYMATHPYTGNRHAPFVGLGSQLWLQSQGALQQELQNQRQELVGCPLDPSMLFADWRAYIGFASIWLTDDDWTRLGSAARAALLSWVAQGGKLFYCTPNPTEQKLRSAGVPGGGTSHQPYGMGGITGVHWDGEPMRAAAMATAILDTAAGDHSAILSNRYQSGWGLRALVPDNEMHTALMVAAILLFAFIVGPVNLIVLAGKRRRHRLFWTTPAISIAASAAVMALILFQDGIGGEGARVAIVHLLPDARQEIVIQEQVSRTGLVVHPSYPLPDRVYQAPIPRAAVQNPRAQVMRRSPEGCDGDWFTSRSVQAQYLSDIRPSRARFELLNADAVDTGREEPVLLSTMETTLEQVFYIDRAGRYWYTEELPVGRKTRLAPSTRSTYWSDWWPTQIRESGISGGGHIDALKSREGYVYGVVSSPAGSFIPTNDHIAWTHEKMIVLGPCERLNAGAS